MYDSFAKLQNVNIGSKHDICAILEPLLVYYSLPSSKQIISGQAYDHSVWIVPLPAFSMTEMFSNITQEQPRSRILMPTLTPWRWSWRMKIWKKSTARYAKKMLLVRDRTLLSALLIGTMQIHQGNRVVKIIIIKCCSNRWAILPEVLLNYGMGLWGQCILRTLCSR